MPDNDLDIIFNETLRQYKITQEFIDRLEGKLVNILGFIFVFIGILFTQDIFLTMLQSPSWFVAILSFLGLISIIYSAVLAYNAYGITKYETGPELEEVVEAYERNDKINFKEAILWNILDAIKTNDEIHTSKKEIIKNCYFYLGVGTLILIISRFMYVIS
ncbi:hypothetical protein BMS3Abin16_00208 [archaeon BMS3Abin16]|nr:hypothetical protein BMS3Abin16_00208 [archaeon BMS3Abin16]